MPNLGPWLLVLLPGFLSFGVARISTNLAGWTDFDLGLLSLALALLNIVLAGGFTWLHYRIRRILNQKSALFSFVELIEDWSCVFRFPYFFFYLPIIVISTGVFVAVAYRANFPSTAIQKVITDAFGYQSTDIRYESTIDQLLVAAEKGGFTEKRFDARHQSWGPLNAGKKPDRRVLRLVLKDDKYEILGRVRRYHIWDETPQLYLSPVCIITPVGSTPEIDAAVSGVWLPLSSLSRIEFLDDDEVPCIDAQLKSMNKP